MKWMKNSNVITVTKSVTSIDSVVTRYLLSSKSEGVTIDGEIWSDVKQYPTSDRKYVWAYETYYYTDRTTGSTQPYIVDTYQSPRFEVTFSSDSYEVHPRWSSDSYFEFSISLLNGLTGTPQFVMVSSSRGIGIPVLDENTGKYLISIANSIDTATSFTFKIIIKDCVETFTVYGKLVDANPLYLGCFDTIPSSAAVNGDYFVAKSKITATVNGIEFIINEGECWEYNKSIQQNWSIVNIYESEKYLNALNGLIKNNVNLEDLSSNSAVSWFKEIISKRIISEFIFSNDIVVGNSIRGGGYNESGVNLGGPGFWLCSDGTAKITDGNFDMATISEASITDASLQDVSINGNIGNKAFCAHTLPEFTINVTESRTVTINGTSSTKYCTSFDSINDKLSVDGSSYYGTTEKDLMVATTAYVTVNGTKYVSHSYVPIVVKRGTDSNNRITINIFANNSADLNTIYSKVATLVLDDSNKWFTSDVPVSFYSGDASVTAGIVNLLPMNLVEASESQKYIEYTDGSKYVMGKGSIGTQWLPFKMMVANLIYGAESNVHTCRASVFEGETLGGTAKFTGNVNDEGTTNVVYGAVFN